MLDFESLFYSITSPLVLVDRAGQPQLLNESGQRAFPQLLLWGESVRPGELLNPAQVIETTLRLAIPAWLATEQGVVKLTPLWNEGERSSGQARKVRGAALGLLAWIPELAAQSGLEKLHILQEVSQAVNSSLILEDIFEALGEVLRDHIPYQEAVIVILDDTQNGIKILVRIPEDGLLEITGENNVFAGYEPLVDQVLRHPYSHLYGRDALPDSFLLAENAASALVVPLINKGVVIGLIAMSTEAEGGFYHYQEELLMEVSAQLAVAVENAKFYWQTQAQASREFLINQLTRSIRQSLDIDIILGTAVTELGKVIGVSRCFIRYFSPTGEEKAFQYQLPGTPTLDPVKMLAEKDVFQLRKDQLFNPFILNDVRDGPPQWVATPYFEEGQIKSLAIFPILIREQLVGTITLHQCDSYRAWVIEDIELLKAMAEHLGVALNQAQLFLELDQQKRALEQTLEELQQAQLYLIQSEKMAVLGQFVAGIAHEVNTPLGTMMSNNATLKGCVEKLKRCMMDSPENMGTATDETVHGPTPEQLFASVDNLLALNKLASTRIQEIVKNLRNFARLDESELKTVDLHEGIESTLLLVQSALDPRIQLIRRYGTNIPPIQCYPGLLNQVFMNLIVNAGHAIQDMLTGKAQNGEGGTHAISIETVYHPEKEMVTISIADTGKGIAPEHLSKVFDPGFTTKGAGVGTGLGLALCYRIVEKHEGRIYLESTPNVGTRFFVDIPLRPHGQAS